LNRDAEHPIMRGWGPGWANPAGELYWIEKVWPTAHPLAAAKNQEKGNEEVCVWTNAYGPNKTRVFGSTLGHHNVTVEHPKFLDLVTRGTLWACDKLNDDYLKANIAQRVPVNLAKGAVATASSEESGKNNFAPHSVDGNGGSRWCAANGSFPQWLQLDLGKPQTVTGVAFKWESSTTAYKYRLEGSVDGKSWKVLADRADINKQFDKEEFAAQPAQFLKLTVLGSNTGGWASLWETEVFGTETVEVSPEKTRKQAEEAFLSDVKIPEGFEATLFATPPAVQYPVFVAAAPDGTTFVSVDKNGSLDRNPRRGSIVRLRDIDGDGRADESKLFVADVDSPRGLVWDRDRLYVMHPPHLSAFIDHDGDGISDEQQVLVQNIAFGFADRPADHTSNGVTLGIDGWLYLAIGDFGFMEAEGTDGRKLQFRGGGVVRVRPDGSGLEIYSRGTRNILEVALDPFLNGFTRDNTNDGDGWDIRLHHFSGLEHHGYPSLFKHFSEEIVQPLADYGGGSGCGALYVAEPGFPEGYGNTLYTADWGRNWVYRHQMTPNGATFTPDQHEFVGATRVTDLD
ncbi:MAG: heme-binding protein, partial [Planctomycetales bacterium 12-60-4]